MDETQDSRYDELLVRVLMLPEAERLPFLEAECDDPELRSEILRAAAEGEADLDGFLEEPASFDIDSESLAEATEPSPRPRPDAVGPYQVLETLGEGGMGVVYLVEQKQPVERRLALKLIRSSLPSAEIAARFAAERQAMARLSHPNIALMYEAGTTEDGFPYFAMEYVDGTAVIEYCDQRRLSIDERLRLFVTVCQGVQHAHQRGIIHRDLKPSNVLITEVEGAPVPKIIDFGIAKALDQPLTDATLLTGANVVGTPVYMSPESFQSGDAEPVVLDTRTDVYSLGILLYELLTGQRPFETKGEGLAQILQRILHEDAPVPSTRVADLEELTGAMAATRRQLDRASLRQRLTGDLDWIVSRAIAKDRDERYGSATELAADVERHLRDEPVLARAPSAGYRLKKFVRRHRAWVAAAIVAIAAIVAGVVGITVSLIRAQRAEAVAIEQSERARLAEAQALRQAAAARQVSDFLVELFEVSQPGEAQGNEVTARQLLDRGAERIGRELGDQPLVQARMMATLGTVYGQLGLYDQSEKLLEEALELRRSELGDHHLEVAESLIRLGDLYRVEGRLEEAVGVIEEGLAIQEDLLGSEAPELVETLESLIAAHNNRGSFDQAESLSRRALRLAETLYGPESSQAGNAMWGLGRAFRFRSRYEEAEPLFLRALEIQRETLGSDHPRVARTLTSLAGVATLTGRFEESATLNLQALAIYEKVSGPEHPQVALVLNNLGYQLFRAGRYSEARRHLERGVAIDKKTLSYDHSYAASRLTNLGLTYWKLGRLAEAVPLFQEATAIRDRVLEPTHPHRATSIWGLANVYRDQGRFEEAEGLYLQALEIRENALQPGDAELLDAQREYAALLRQTGREDEATVLEAKMAAAGG